MRALIVLEPVNYAARRVVQESVAVFFEVLVCIRPPVQCLDVFIIQVDGSCSIFNNLFPASKRVIASGSVRIEYWVWLAKNGLPVQLDCVIVALVAVRLVTGDF